MNVPMSWLKEYVDLNCSVKEFEDDMTMSGSKVEETVEYNKEISGVVVGRIIKIEKHPDADKLVITQTDIGTKVSQIVTGADNIFEGAYVPVATDGSVIAGGVKIKKGKLRGVSSEGMLCSIDELGYTRQDYPEAPENGIYIFKEEQTLGADVSVILELKEDIVEFEITSNRVDCYSIVGLAREAAATYNKAFKYPEITLKEEGSGEIAEMIQVEIEDEEICHRYIARAVVDVKIEPSPQWMRHRLTTAGIRPINNFVDITNYVMLELGQPMHAFDIDNISNKKIIVRKAKEGEEFTTLDGIIRTLDSTMTVIADCNKAVAVAGVMGGENSKVTENATAILFESANFYGSAIRKTSKKLGLRTDSSAKYEKGLDPNLAEDAVNRAVQLVELLACGKVVKGFVDSYPRKRVAQTVEFSYDGINKLLGTKITAEVMDDYLKKIDIDSKDGKAKIPTFRADIEGQADIAEEIARFYGYNNIGSTLSTGTVGRKSFKQTVEDIIKDTMVAYGLCEAMTYSFESPKVFDKLNISKDNELRKVIEIQNPLGEDFSVMRTLTLNGILQSLSTNYNRRNKTAYLFEQGKVYLAKELPLKEQPEERNILTIGMYGDTDFYKIKGILEKLFEILGINSVDFTQEKNLEFMHPGRCAAMFLKDSNLGFLGELHPKVSENYEIGTKVYVATVNLDILIENAVLDREYVPLAKFPVVQRDIAMLIKNEIPVRDIVMAIKEKAGKTLEDVTLFDVYTGSQIENGYKSVAYSLSFRAEDRTLTDEEVSKTMDKILENLNKKLDAKLREQ